MESQICRSESQISGGTCPRYDGREADMFLECLKRFIAWYICSENQKEARAAKKCISILQLITLAVAKGQMRVTPGETKTTFAFTQLFCIVLTQMNPNTCPKPNTIMGNHLSISKLCIQWGTCYPF